MLFMTKSQSNSALLWVCLCPAFCLLLQKKQTDREIWDISFFLFYLPGVSKHFCSLQLQSTSNKAIKTGAGRHTETHTHFPLSCFKWELANIRTSLSLSLSPSAFFYLAHPQSLSITSLLLPSLFSLFCLPPQPSCQCQCLMALSKAAHPPPISIWEKFNWIGSQSITASIEPWLDLARADGVRWVGRGGVGLILALLQWR